jgi:hypothetical protein
MKIHKLITHSLRAKGLVGHVSAAVNANLDGRDDRSVSRLSSRHRIVQRGGETIVDEHEVRTHSSVPDQPTDEKGETHG